MRIRELTFIALFVTALAVPVVAGADARIDGLKKEAVAEVEKKAQLTQQMVDMIFSFGELGFQEVETSRYLTDLLQENGFEVQKGVAGIPTAFVATWGSGKPVISFGSDIDCIPKASQTPGVAWHEPLIENAPGHGEGHNSGLAVNVTAALALKQIMEKENLPGTLHIWPGVAEELLGTKAYFVRAGMFKDVDIVLFTHVSNGFNVSWGAGRGSGLVSVEYTFRGDAAHAGSAPWQGRSALDAVELMNASMNFRREHLRLPQRTHYVITVGGDQPNVVPPLAKVWYFFREIDYDHIKRLFDIGNKAAEGAALMTDTETEYRILGTAWPRHFNKVVAETMHENIKQVGMPAWREDDQALAKAAQKVLGNEVIGLRTEVGELSGPPTGPRLGGGSDDIGDVSWTVPTVTLRYPANIPNLQGHHWSSGIAMATPIAHKGCTAGAKVMAMTALDFLLQPELVQKAWDYFNNEQNKDTKYTPLISATDQPAIDLNEEHMAKYREEMRKLYYDPTKYKTYLEQLGVEYPTLTKSSNR
jgi:aminobenzoyl-glutamate utilization protein B